MITRAQASGLIRQPNGQMTLDDADARTGDIMDLIRESDCHAWKDTTALADRFPPTAAGLRDLWQFVRTQIRYVEDPPGQQYIQSPAALWASMQGDCKSMSLFICSVIRNWMRAGYEVDYVYRFVSYPGDYDIRHVYVMVLLGDEWYVMDAVHDVWDEELDYSYKKDLYGACDIPVEGSRQSDTAISGIAIGNNIRGLLMVIVLVIAIIR